MGRRDVARRIVAVRAVASGTRRVAHHDYVISQQYHDDGRATDRANGDCFVANTAPRNDGMATMTKPWD
jgi:hypothetical protein